MHKKYRIDANDTFKLVRISPEMHHGLELIARDMTCTLQEVVYRLLIRGMAWYLLNVKIKEGEAKTAEWVRAHGAEPYQSGRWTQRYVPRPNARSSFRNRNIPEQKNILPEGYFPAEL